LANQYQNFEDWKRKIAAIAYENNYILWDFSGYNTITTEPVKTPMKFYWDSSHVKENVGDYILNRLLNKSDDQNIPKDFGTKINPSNIDQHLAIVKQKRKQYLDSNRESIKRTHKLIKNALSGGELDPDTRQGIFK